MKTSVAIAFFLFLVGLILAFVGAVQLTKFRASMHDTAAVRTVTTLTNAPRLQV
jgi:hypothetical protein